MATKKADKHIFRRLSQVYVEIPPSPLHRSRNASISAPHVPSANQSRKENALLPLANSHMTQNQTSSHKKRKRDTEESSDMTLVDNEPVKKSKSSGPKGSTAAGEFTKPKVSEDFPDGYHYCHQCYRKRDQSAVIRCTFKVTKEQNCGAKYCKACLKNRYGLDFDAIKAKGETGKSKERSKHVAGQGHIFKCPRCLDSCNCVRCRKAKGLEPTGKVLNIDEISSKVDGVNNKLSQSTARKKVKDQNSVSAATAKKTGTIPPQVVKKPRAPLRPKPLPKPVWTGIPISLSLSDAEDRFHIREFVLRFASALGISRTHVEELEEIQGGFRGRGSEDDDDNLVPWVSEPCVKSIILGLLGMLDLDGEAAKSTDVAIKEIKHSGANLNKLWTELLSLRDSWSQTMAIPSSSASSGKMLTFPDPLPPPESATVHQTRSGAAQKSATGVNVIRTAQLVPVLHALVEAAIETNAVREELDSGLQEAKERAREAREGLKRENERFEQEKEQGEDKKDKSKLQHHKRITADIDQVLRLSTHAYTPRLSPLGRDHEGRTYWALSPGMVEIEAALDTLSSVSQGTTVSRKARGRRRMVPSKEDRSSFRKWSWFIAVWGMLPPPEERKVIKDSEDDIHDDCQDEEEQWWAFWNPEEISKLATWIAAKAGLSEKESKASDDDRNTHSGIRLSGAHSPRVESSVNGEEADESTDEDENDYDNSGDSAKAPTRGQLKILIKGLQDYSALLKWRTSREEEEEDHKVTSGDSQSQ